MDKLTESGAQGCLLYLRGNKYVISTLNLLNSPRA